LLLQPKSPSYWLGSERLSDLIDALCAPLQRTSAESLVAGFCAG
jgi:hypothetical protein